MTCQLWYQLLSKFYMFYILLLGVFFFVGETNGETNGAIRRAKRWRRWSLILMSRPRMIQMMRLTGFKRSRILMENSWIGVKLYIVSTWFWQRGKFRHWPCVWFFLVSKTNTNWFATTVVDHWRRTSEVAARIHGGPLGRCLTEADILWQMAKAPCWFQRHQHGCFGTLFGSDVVYFFHLHVFSFFDPS